LIPLTRALRESSLKETFLASSDVDVDVRELTLTGANADAPATAERRMIALQNFMIKYLKYWWMKE
jgi:hypothetical protein